VIQCPTCKQVLEPGVRFCPHDGTPLTETAAFAGVPTPTGERPASREIALPVVIGGRYRLEEVRGGGGMAKVYRGVDVTLEREVAVKLINPDLRQDAEFDARFQREARIASQLADPHIVVVHDFGIDPTHGPYLVMEYLHGQSLRERLLSGGPLPLKAGLQLSAQLFLAMIHAHSKNIIHRDIKPDNIFLLNQSGVRLHVRVLDFGIARILRRDEPGRAETLTSPGAVLGTPRYMSPEQLAGQQVDVRSDVYSAAMVIHEALTGHLPHVTGKKLNELCPEATPALQDLLDHCLKPNPTERPPTAVEVYLRLQELGKASGILLLPPGAMDKLVAARQANQPTVAYKPTEPERPHRRRFWLVAGGVLLAVGGIAAVARFYVFPPAAVYSGPDSLLGVKIGDRQEDVVQSLMLVKGGRPGNPWKSKPAAAYLGHVLLAKDLNLSDEALEEVEARRNTHDTVCVIFCEEKVRAVVVRQPHEGGTAHGLKIGSPRSAVDAVYPEDPSDIETDKTKSPIIEMRRYGPRGVGVEIQDGKVIGIALYPPAGGK
jgi:hypothetical protein